MTPKLVWFKTQSMKTMTNSLWDPEREKNDDYYRKLMHMMKHWDFGLYIMLEVKNDQHGIY